MQRRPWKVTSRSVIASSLIVITLAGCTGDTATVGHRGPDGTPSASAPTMNGAANPEPQVTAKRTTKPAPGPTRSRGRETQWYIDRLPRFGPAPPPERVTFPHEPGRAPWVKRIPTQQNVAFLTIDDGWVKRPEALDLLRAARVPVSLFLTVNAMKDNPGYFRALQGNGAMIESHTITHRMLRGMSYAGQRQEICGSSDWLAAQYGRRPTLFRPPFGEKDDATLRAAYDCGMAACFFWTETVDKGKVFYQTAEKRINRGDIILMHFREAFADDFLAALTAIKAAGLTPALLESYVSVHSDG